MPNLNGTIRIKTVIKVHYVQMCLLKYYVKQILTLTDAHWGNRVKIDALILPKYLDIVTKLASEQVVVIADEEPIKDYMLPVNCGECVQQNCDGCLLNNTYKVNFKRKPDWPPLTGQQVYSYTLTGDITRLDYSQMMELCTIYPTFHDAKEAFERLKEQYDPKKF